MQRITLHNTGVQTSRLGFGCVSLTTHPRPRDAIRVLHSAFDAGVTHFDTARLYGSGRSEVILGEFLKDVRDRVTLTSKFGLFPSNPLRGFPVLLNLAKGVVRRSALARRIARRTVGSGPMPAGRYSPADARLSLETSLRALGTDRIDFFMLHCAGPSDAARDDLNAFLESQISRGTIRAFGPSSEVHTLGLDAGAFPSSHRVVQLDSNAAVPNMRRLRNTAGRDFVTFGVIGQAKRWAAAAAASPAVVARHRALLGFDPTDPSALGRELLVDALDANPHGLVIFGSMSPERAKANAAAADLRPDPVRLGALAKLLSDLDVSGSAQPGH